MEKFKKLSDPGKSHNFECMYVYLVLYHSNVKGHNDLNLVNPKAITLIFLRTEWEHFFKEHLYKQTLL